MHYLQHTEQGLSIRAVARAEGCHASTILRRIRRFEQKRDDPLVDEALSRLGEVHFRTTKRSERSGPEEIATMTAHFTPVDAPCTVCDETTVNREAKRILRRLSETGALLAIAPDMEKAAVLRNGPDGRATRIAVVDRMVARAFALKEWIACKSAGRVGTYAITPAGRSALKRLLSEDCRHTKGFAEAAMPFAEQHREWGHKVVLGDDGTRPRRVRYNMAESPVVTLSRRREKDGTPFLNREQVVAAERLREDFELAQMGPRVTQNWERFLTGGARGGFSTGGPGTGPESARERVARALEYLGPGLGDMVLRCCCFLEGLEATEKRMNWSARSGKIVLRIALDRLARHYEREYGPGRDLIG
ncbi:DUF6456 domain-containing protein [Tropicimonas sp.]|uniref:DUF6456 domain-containing protein n=1 Tax=Tropicimonas sp. TaxID=2067044 RepID=UPI003A83E915